MIYLKGDGTGTCSEAIKKYVSEFATQGDSPFNTGELYQELNPGEPLTIDHKNGTKIVDFTFLNHILTNDIEDINRTDCYPALQEVVTEFSGMDASIEYCILVPDIEMNESASVRAKLYQELRINNIGKILLTKQDDNYYNSYRSNPFMFRINDRNVSLLSLEEPITTKLKEAYDG